MYKKKVEYIQPPGMRGLMVGLTSRVLREQPSDILTFAAEHFEALVAKRDAQVLTEEKQDEGYSVSSTPGPRSISVQASTPNNLSSSERDSDDQQRPTSQAEILGNLQPGQDLSEILEKAEHDKASVLLNKDVNDPKFLAVLIDFSQNEATKITKYAIKESLARQYMYAKLGYIPENVNESESANESESSHQPIESTAKSDFSESVRPTTTSPERDSDDQDRPKFHAEILGNISDAETVQDILDKVEHDRATGLIHKDTEDPKFLAVLVDYSQNKAADIVEFAVSESAFRAPPKLKPISESSFNESDTESSRRPVESSMKSDYSESARQTTPFDDTDGEQLSNNYLHNVARSEIADIIHRTDSSLSKNEEQTRDQTRDIAAKNSAIDEYSDTRAESVMRHTYDFVKHYS